MFQDGSGGWLTRTLQTICSDSVLQRYETEANLVVRAQLGIVQPQAPQAETQATAVVYSTRETEQTHKRGHSNPKATVGTQVAFS